MDLKLVNDLTESRMYRSKQAFKRITAREVADMAFMDMIAIWILYNEFESAPASREYAGRTATFNSFNNFRQMSTDLYLNLHVITQNRTDLLGTDADVTLLDRIQPNEQQILRYLRMAHQNNLSQGMARQTLQRLEFALHIQNSNYRSIRRLAQGWPNLSTGQKRIVLTRMIFFYRTHARRSEMYQYVNSLARNHDLIDSNASNPESRAAKIAGAAAVATAATMGGYALGSRIGDALTK